MSSPISSIHVGTSPAHRNCPVIKPKSRVPKLLVEICQKRNKGVFPDFGAVPDGQDDLGVWRSVVKFFPVDIPGDILICLESVLLVFFYHSMDGAMAFQVVVPDFGQKVDVFA